jgi:hypothetical protein
MQPHIRQRMADVGHLGFYLQDSKFEGVFPHLSEYSIMFGIRWLGGIGEKFRLTRSKRYAFQMRTREIAEKIRVGG